MFEVVHVRLYPVAPAVQSHETVIDSDSTDENLISPTDPGGAGAPLRPAIEREIQNTNYYD